MKKNQELIIRLDKDTQEISEFIIKAIYNFEKEHETPRSIGIYSCPWAGWISMNFNLTRELEEADWNCPDFEFVEYDLIDFNEWSEKYEISFDSILTIEFDTEFYKSESDETLNRIFFQYLKRVIKDIKFNKNYKILLQMLDSNCVEKIKV